MERMLSRLLMLHCCALWLGEGPLVVACSCRHRCCMLLRLVGDGWRIARDDVEQHLETEDPAGNGIRYPFANFKLTHDHQRGQSTSKGLLALYEPSSSPCRVFGPGFKRFLFEITVGSARLAPPPHRAPSFSKNPNQASSTKSDSNP